MKLLFFIFIFFLNPIHSDLVDDRIINAKKWIDGSHSVEEMEIRYSTSVVIDDICHVVESTGDFCGRFIAKEYDSIVLVVKILSGIQPVIVWTLWDPSTIKWVGNDILQVDFEMNVTTAYDFTNNIYLVNNQTFRLREYITFVPNSDLIKLGYTIHDSSANKAFALVDAILPHSILCAGIIFPACNVSTGIGNQTYLTDTGYNNIEECITFLDNLENQFHPCPYAQRSNTDDCRNLHGISAFVLPSLHCAHVRPNSAVCVDTCLPSCSNCHQNAECVASHPGIPTNFTVVYECQCKKGYIGNGTFCEPLSCDNHDKCPGLYGSYECSTGLCKCTETFNHQPEGFGTKNLCICPNDGQIVYNNSGIPFCVPVGKCLQNQWECNLQSYQQVKCATFGINTFTLFKDCLCNYGFSGGWEYPCHCDSSKKIVYSSYHNGQVCLSTQECTENYHCTSSNTCHFQSGNPIGTCS